MRNLGNRLIGITGSHGFIGQNLVNLLSRRPELQIRRFDRNKHDLLDVASLADFVQDLDFLFHAGGVNRDENAKLIKVNCLGTSNLLDAIKLYGSPDNLKFIYFSSFQVYSPTENDDPVNEDVFSNPQTLFGVSKRCGEDLVRISGIDSNIVRIANVYGPLCRPFYNSVISTFCHLIYNNKGITVNGNGNQARDFIFIDDVVSALEKFIDHPSKGAKIFNLCGQGFFSLNDIIKELKEISGKKVEVTYNKTSDPPRYLSGNNEKIRKALGWKAETSMKSGLEKTYQWIEDCYDSTK